jgi:2-methylcitrate dehydratase PrpD
VTSLTDALVHFVIDTPASDIPERARANAVDTIVDAAGTTWAGVGEDASSVIRTAALATANAGPSRIAGRDELVDASVAALCNASAAHSLDYDAINFAVSGFVGSATLAALSAIAEERALPASDVVTAYCFGWEAGAILGRALNPEHYDLGWHPTATLALTAATMGLCRLTGCSVAQTTAALSVAVSETSGIKIMIGNMLNAYHVGKAARNAVNALRLAEAGFDGHPQPLDAVQGMLALFAGRGGPHLEPALKSVGTVWDLQDPGPVWKVHACCGLIHSGLDAVAILRERERLSPDEILGARVLLHSFVPRVMHVQEPTSGYAAKFSIPYCIAAGIRDGRAGLRAFDRVDPELVAIAQRVTYGVHPDLQDGDTFFEREFTDVRLETTRGVFEQRVNRMENRGTGSIPVATLRDKFIECVERSDTMRRDPEEEFNRLRGIDSGDKWELWPR